MKLAFFTIRRIWSCHVVLQRTVTKCTKSYNARAWALFCSLHILSGYVCVAVAIVASFNSLLTTSVFNSKSLGAYVEDLSLAIRKNLEHKGSSAIHGRFELLLCALVGLAINQRDTITG